jgi:hypothetical protein
MYGHGILFTWNTSFYYEGPRNVVRVSFPHFPAFVTVVANFSSLSRPCNRSC